MLTSQAGRKVVHRFLIVPIQHTEQFVQVSGSLLKLSLASYIVSTWKDEPVI